MKLVFSEAMWQGYHWCTEIAAASLVRPCDALMRCQPRVAMCKCSAALVVCKGTCRAAERAAAHSCAMCTTFIANIAVHLWPLTGRGSDFSR